MAMDKRHDLKSCNLRWMATRVETVIFDNILSDHEASASDHPVVQLGIWRVMFCNVTTSVLLHSLYMSTFQEDH